MMPWIAGAAVFYGMCVLAVKYMDPLCWDWQAYPYPFEANGPLETECEQSASPSPN